MASIAKRAVSCIKIVNQLVSNGTNLSGKVDRDGIHLELHAIADSGHEVSCNLFSGHHLPHQSSVIYIFDHEVQTGSQHFSVRLEFSIVFQISERYRGKV